VTAVAYVAVRQQAQQLQDELTSRMKAGQSELEAAKLALREANSKHDVKLVAQAKDHFAAAKAQFLGASQLADRSQLLHGLEQLPDIGSAARSRHRAIDGIAGMGVAISNAGLDLSKLVSDLIQPAGTNKQQSRTLLTVLQETSKSLVTIRSELADAKAAAAIVDVNVLPTAQQATFIKAKATIGTAVASVDEFERLVPVLEELLGGNGIRTYLIEQVNPAELRPGGGLIGTYSVLRADHGSLQLVRSGSSDDIVNPRRVLGQPGYVAPPGPLRQLLIGTLSWSFFDSNFFPDFPANAQAGERFAQPRLGMHLDGVISIDYYTVAKMLGLTGGIPVPGYRLTLNEANFIKTVVDYDLAAYTDPTAAATHKAILAAVAGPLMNRLTSLPPAQWPSLIQALNDLVSQRHLQAYFNNPTVEAQVVKFGWSGTLNNDSTPDFMMEIESNLGATKANYFITRHYTVTLTTDGNVLHHRVVIDITNNMPYGYRPNEFYRVYVSLYVPASASSTSSNLTSMQDPNGAPPAGMRRLDGWTTIAGYGRHRQVVFSYDTPRKPGPVQMDSIYWQKQPGTYADKIDLIWNVGASHILKASGDLAQDRVINLLPTGLALTVGQQGQAQLPGLSLG